MTNSRGPSRGLSRGWDQSTPAGPGGPAEQLRGEERHHDGSGGTSGGQSPTPTAGPSGGLSRRRLGKTPIKDGYDSDSESSDMGQIPFNLLDIDLSKDLDPLTLKPPHAKLGKLKALNYQTWAQDHQIFLEGRGIFVIVSGDLTCPKHDKSQARKWLMIDNWIATLIAGNVEETQKSHIAHLRSSKGIWDALNRVHGGRVVPMLQKLLQYTKSGDQSIDQMAADMRNLRSGIAKLKPSAAPSDLSMAVLVMIACKGREFDMAKYMLRMSDSLTMESAVERLRRVEQDTLTDSGLVARKARRGRRGRGKR